MKALNKIKSTALWLWQLPQNIIGYCLYKYYKGYEICTKEICGNDIHCRLSNNINGGVTLGNYIILNNVKYLQHEIGHTKQSKKLGPLYLFVIGIPSIIHAALHTKLCKQTDYYHFYTEHWLMKK